MAAKVVKLTKEGKVQVAEGAQAWHQPRASQITAQQRRRIVTIMSKQPPASRRVNRDIAS